MLVPDNIHPGANHLLQRCFCTESDSRASCDGYARFIHTDNSEREMSMPVFVLCLDWLFLLNLVTLNDSRQGGTMFLKSLTITRGDGAIIRDIDST